MIRADPGWYPDPSGWYAYRYWDGETWTEYVSTAGRVAADPMGRRPRAPTEATLDLGALARFLAAEQQRGVIDDTVAAQLAADARALTTAPVPGAASTTTTIRPPQAAPAAAPAPRAPGPPTAPALVPPPPRPAAAAFPSVGRWWHAARPAVSADLAVNWLSYLGVVLLFAGVLGLVVFSFGEVREGARPLAETAVPLAAFAAAWILPKRATRVKRALTLLGGVLLMVTALASVLDGTSPPPDVSRGSVVAVTTAIAALVCSVFVVAWRRDQSSVLRHLVWPGVWVTVAMAANATTDPAPIGRDVARPSAWQMAIVASVVAVGSVARRSRPQSPGLEPLRLALAIGVPMAYGVGLLGAARDGWPAGPLVVTALAAVLGLEGLAPLVSVHAIGGLQVLVSLGGIASLGEPLGAGWASAVGVAWLLGLVELHGRRDLRVAVLGGTLGAVAVLLAISASAPGAMLAAYLVAGGWALARRARPLPGLLPSGWADLTELQDIVVGLLPLGAAAGLGGLIDPDAVLAVSGAFVLLVALGVRSTHHTGDRLAQVWVPLAASLVALASTGLLGGLLGDAEATGFVARPTDSAGVLAVGVAAAAAAMALAPRWPIARLWSCAVTSAWALHLAAIAVDLGRGAEVVGAAAVALVVVVGARWVGGSVAEHARLTGLLLGILAIGAAPGRTTLAAGLGLSLLGWVVVTADSERGLAPLAPLDRVLHTPSPGVGAAAAPAVALIELPALLLLVADLAGLVAIDGPRAPLIVSACALATAAVALRLRHRHPLVAVTAGLSLVLGLGAVVAEVVLDGPVTAAVALALASVVLVDRSVRWVAVPWIGWGLAGVLTVVAARDLGMAPEGWPHAALAWGLVATTAAHVADRVRAERGSPLWESGPPAILGTAAMASGYVALVDLGRETLGWWSLGLAVAVLVAAVVRRVPVMTGLSCALGAVSLFSLTTWPLHHPWSLVLIAAALVGVAELLPRQAGVAPLRRWDLPPLVAAHVLTLIALGAAGADDAAVTWTAAGSLSLAVGGLRRRVEWLATGAILVLGGAAAAGPGWRTAGLLAAAVCLSVAALRITDRRRSLLITGGAAAAGLAWVSLIEWRSWEVERAVVATSLGAGGASLALGALTRAAAIGRDWALRWGALAVAGLGGSALVLLGSDLDDRSAGYVLGASIAVLAASTGVSAAPLRMSLLRELAAVMVVCVLAPASWAGELDAAALSNVAGTLAVVLAVVSIAHHAWWPASLWQRSVLLVVGGHAGISVLAGLVAPGTLDLALAASGLAAAALGLGHQRFELLVVAAVLEAGAWVAFASDAFRGDPGWQMVGVGLALLLVSAIDRAHRRANQLPVATVELALIEVLGMALLAGPFVARTVTASLGWGAVAAVVGSALGGWGILTRVRRRLEGGAVVVAVALALLVGAPLAELVPAWTGPALWLALVGLGALALVAAASIEVGRRQVKQLAGRVHDIVEGWE